MELPKNNDITYFAETNFRNQKIKFGIRPDDRRRHLYSVGKTGMGKTAMLENMAIQDIQKGHGLAVVDPHGEFAEKMLDFVPSSRVNDVIYFNPADIAYPIAFNVIEKVQPDFRYLIASGVLGVFKKIWPDVWSPRMEYILNNTILALIEYPGATLLGINRMLAEKEYRDKVVKRITDPGVKAFWLNEFSKYPDRFREEAVAPIQNKAGQFISSPLIRNIIGQTKSTINVRKVIDEGKILILNLSKGRIGEDASHLLGALMVSKIQLAAMSRVNIPEEERKDFYLYVDEFQNFATESFVNILSEARKYHLCLILAHQYITQMDEKVRDAVFGNVGTLTTFRVGADDAEVLEPEFTPEFTAQDLVNLAKYNVYLKLMIDGISSRAFSAATLVPFQRPKENYRETIIKVSRERYGTFRTKIEEKIVKWSGTLELPVRAEEKERALAAELYEAQCWDCGKWTRVTFKPDGVRPVYCKSCLKKTREQKEQQKDYRGNRENRENRESEGNLSLKEAFQKEPVFFRPRKKEEEKFTRTRVRPDIGGLRKILTNRDRDKEDEYHELLENERGGGRRS
ncbi:MAG: hypothetical protein COV69_00795 [Parcubacteria group bacterium CG11_big_fil_rev_8_21_14_0_20_39_14]|nr:MAG: hypothetical protein COV69_00795 [Parcubacteria group bacterium CG11_big_fil_rev_8_21_14_0_20_39_14]PIS35739.1 MAG: hypothetical protein COT36_00730 [Parcubacteria group bacterium CG08_land_8_20_14_0_20_38_56]